MAKEPKPKVLTIEERVAALEASNAELTRQIRQHQHDPRDGTVTILAADEPPPVEENKDKDAAPGGAGEGEGDPK